MSLKILTGDWIDEDKTVTFLVDWANNHQLLATTKKLLLFSKKVRRGITRITVGRSQTWYLEHIAQYRIHVQVWCIVGSVSKLTQSARLENMRKSKRIRVDLSAKSATGTSPCKKKTADLRKPAIYRRSPPNIWKTEKTSELSEDHGRLPYRIVWIIPTELLRESMAFMRRCIIAVDLFGPTPKVLSTPRRQASEKLDVPAEVRPTQITEERFFRLLLRRVSSFFFARIRDRSENTGDTFFYFFFL